MKDERRTARLICCDRKSTATQAPTTTVNRGEKNVLQKQEQQPDAELEKDQPLFFQMFNKPVPIVARCLAYRSGT